jgi:NADP-reducing hydrogenase subunit HndB
MSKLSIEKLRELRARKQEELGMTQEHETGVARILVGMGTCGVAAGARATYEAICDELEKTETAGTEVKPTGCLGQCYSEPTVEVIVPGMPTIVYGNVDAEVGRKIVRKHVVGGHLINDHIFDRPSADLLKHA